MRDEGRGVRGVWPRVAPESMPAYPARCPPPPTLPSRPLQLYAMELARRAGARRTNTVTLWRIAVEVDSHALAPRGGIAKRVG